MSHVKKQRLAQLAKQFKGLDPFCVQEPFSHQVNAQECHVASGRAHYGFNVSILPHRGKTL